MPDSAGRHATSAALLFAAAGALALGLVACGSSSSAFTGPDEIEEQLRERVARDLPPIVSAGDGACALTEERENAREYECTVDVYAVMPRNDRLVRYLVVATDDGEVAADYVGG
jgi:hypothetical protein